jgi:glycerophosphoryl diester phosphodiesterase
MEEIYMKIRGIAHRGYPGKFPENTLSSFQAACDLNFTHLELDVHLSKDGVPVVTHDYSIDRLSDGKGFIRDYTLKELKQFSIGGTETIPTLEETMDLLKGKIKVLIELKQAGDMYPNLEEATLNVVYSTDTLEQSQIISFDHFSLMRTRELNKDIELGALCSGNMPHVFPFMKEMRCTFLGSQLKFLTPVYDKLMRDNGIVCGPGVINSLEEMEIIAEKYPAALVTTDELERWADIYKSNPKLQIF